MEASAGSRIPFTEASLPVPGFGKASALDLNGFYEWREWGKLSLKPFHTGPSASLRLIVALWRARLWLKHSFVEVRNNCL